MSGDITARLEQWQRGDRSALEQVMPGLYQSLRQIALRRLAREQHGLTVEPTDLVHEAMARLLGSGKAIANRLHFLAVAALYMRSILTDRARAILAGRRPAPGMGMTLGAIVDGEPATMLDLLALDQALNQLEVEDPRAARALELHSFSGMTVEEIAQLLELSAVTVRRDLRFARAFVNHALQ